MRKAFLIFLFIFCAFLAFTIGAGTRFSSSGFNLSSVDKVAILTVEDVILDPDKYIESLNKIRKNDSIKALVVRINSPGGAVGPSQEIYSELENINQKIPVVASMGAVAASGGYYIACSADKIYANPGTITGSIGVIAQFVSYKDLLEWAKLDVEVIKSGKFKDIGSPLREISEEEKKYLQQLIDNVYKQFRSTVAKTRKIDSQKLKFIADGRIFSGNQAKNLKLIDELGNVNDAIAEATKLAGIKGDPQILKYPEKKSPIYELISSKFNLTNRFTKYPSSRSFGLFYIVDIIH